MTQQDMTAGHRTAQEVASQPACWRHAAGWPRTWRDRCRPRAGNGWRSRAAAPPGSWRSPTRRPGGGRARRDRRLRRVRVPLRPPVRPRAGITRSGTTTEVLALLERLRGSAATTAVTGDPTTPVMSAADRVVLDFADERSVVQTRFATTALALLRAHLEGQGPAAAGVRSLAQAADDAERAIATAAGPAGWWTRSASWAVDGPTAWPWRPASRCGRRPGSGTEAYPAMDHWGRGGR